MWVGGVEVGIVGCGGGLLGGWLLGGWLFYGSRIVGFLDGGCC
jgi:hypothetical protein